MATKTAKKYGHPKSYGEIEDKIALEVLVERLHQGMIPQKDLEFADSLIKQSMKGLSEKQWYWVKKLGEKPKPTVDTTPKPHATFAVGELVEMFNVAAMKLKHPGFVMAVSDDDGVVGEVKISRSGIGAKYPGTIWMNVHDTSMAYMKPDGEFFFTKRVPDNLKDPLEDLMYALTEKPQQTVSSHGHKTGKCCFCNSPLTDEKSTAAGFGPTCAKNWNLPWGGK
jgi:hypothetical protein